MKKDEKKENELLFGRMMFGTVDDEGNVCETDVTELFRHVGGYPDGHQDAMQIEKLLKEKGIL